MTRRMLLALFALAFAGCVSPAPVGTTQAPGATTPLTGPSSIAGPWHTNPGG
jgi:hypothetical protein